MIKNILIVGILMILCGCKEQSLKEIPIEDSEIFAKVDVSAGELLPGFDDPTIPVFFNVGSIIKQEGQISETIILGQSLKEGKQYGVEPLGYLSFYKDSIFMSYIICQADESAFKSQNFENFMVSNYDLKETIESWFRSQSGEFQCRDFEWSNNYKALLDMDNKALKN